MSIPASRINGLTTLLITHTNRVRYGFDQHAFRPSARTLSSKDLTWTGIDVSAIFRSQPCTALPFSDECAWHSIFKSMAMYNHYNGRRPFKYHQGTDLGLEFTTPALKNVLLQGIHVPWTTDGGYFEFLESCEKESAEWFRDSHYEACEPCREQAAQTQPGRTLLEQELRRLQIGLTTCLHLFRSHQNEIKELPVSVEPCDPTAYKVDPSLWVKKACDQFFHHLATSKIPSEREEGMEWLYASFDEGFTYVDKNRNFEGWGLAKERMALVRNTIKWARDDWVPDGLVRPIIPSWGDTARNIDSLYDEVVIWNQTRRTS